MPLWMVACAAALAVLALGGAALPLVNTRRNRRIAAVVARGSPGRAAPRVEPGILLAGHGGGRRPALDRLVQRLLPRPERLRLRLQRAGFAPDLGRYLGIGAAAGAAAGGLAWLAAGLAPSPLVLTGVAAGIGLPHAVVGWRIRARRQKFLKLFPEAIDLIVRGLKSGLPVTESMKSVGTEIADPVGVEFRSVTDGLGVGNTLEQSLWASAARLGITEFNFFVVALQLQRATGGNLGETLENLADILRRRRQLKLKIRAISAEARASAAIVGGLPFVMFALISVANPAYIAPLIGDIRGNIMLVAGALWLAIGCLVMARMVRFEI